MKRARCTAKRALLFATVSFAASLTVACEGESKASSSQPIAENDGSASNGAATQGDGDAAPAPGDGGNSTTGSNTGEPGASGCKALVREAGVQFGGLKSDKYSWYDRDCKLRTTGLVNSDAPGGGGFARGFTYETAGRTRSALGTNANGWNGFGYLVNHGQPTTTSQGLRGTQRVVFSGAHHAIHEIKTRMTMAGPVDVTVHWFFATGRSHPIFAITHDSTPAGPGVVSSDSRSPYGDIAWDEGPQSDHNVDGVAWGDKYQFVSTSKGPLTPASTWDYTKANTIPFAMEWADEADAEMGLVQTQTFEQLPAGGDYGNGVLAAECWMRTSANKGGNCGPADWTMPHNWLWPMQLNQYELPSTPASHRLAWGTTYGAVGQAQYSAFGKMLSGYPYQSYSVAIVLGTHTGKAVETQRLDHEAAQAARLTASRGTVATTGPGGVGRTDAVTYAPAGYNHVYGVWELVAASNAVTADLTVTGSLTNPVLHVRDFSATALTRVRLNGTELTAGEGYFASIDATSKALWLTVNQVVTGKATIELE